MIALLRNLDKRKTVCSWLILAALFMLYPAAQAQNFRRSRRTDNAPKQGQQAPDFKLKKVNSKEEVQLSIHEGDKPVVLIFGSYT